MWNGSSPWLVALFLAGCSARGALPALSLRALTVLHERASTTSPGHGVDFALALQVSFSEHQRRPRSISYLTPKPGAWNEAVACSDEALCLWASAAEQSALVALGVPP
jgi:hypothetical protein